MLDADVETVNLLGKTSHFKLKYDANYCLRGFEKRLTERVNVTDELIYAFIKTVNRHSIGAFIVIIVARKVTTLQVVPGQLLVEHNVRQIEGLLMNYKEVTNNILVDQVPH